MDCNEVKRQLFLYLDRELTMEEISTVETHLYHCPPCEHRFHFEGRILRVVKASAASETAPAHLLQRIRQSIQATP